MSAPFVHLKVHSEFSLDDSIVRIKSLVNQCVSQQMPAVALTDQGNMYASIKFYKAALNAGIKPILGAEIWLENPQDEHSPYRMGLLVNNQHGYFNLMALISRGFSENQHWDKPIIKLAWLLAANEGLILLCGGRRGGIHQALAKGDNELARQMAETFKTHFLGRFYLEVQRFGLPAEEAVIRSQVVLSQALSLPLVATNDVCFLHADEFAVHETRVAIGQGFALEDKRRPKEFSKQQFFKTTEQMQALFADMPSALENTFEIAKRCSYQIKLGECFLPDFPIPKGMSKEQFFRQVSQAGLKKRYANLQKNIPKEQLPAFEQYQKRLEFELDIIIQMGFPGYFLIVMDFIKWAKEKDIPVGPGRGSGAGSLVAYALDITDLDPLQYDLLFERFLNPERVSMPDFDIDFCMDKREQVIQYVAETYGRNAVSQIVTFGTMAAKAVVRDVARAQDKSFSMADKLSKLIPPTPGMTLSVALEEEPQIKAMLETDDAADEVWKMALKLEGIARQTGKHAGGVVIAPTKLTDFSATACEEDGSGLVTQYDKNDVEEAGLVKFDFLGLRTLTIIQGAVNTINANRHDDEAKLNIDSIALDDKASFDYLKTAHTTAVFQLESMGMKKLVERLKPDSLEDMIALVALFRPGPLESGMVDDFIARKHGKEPVAYPHVDYQHESLKDILEPTYGVIVYQEQVMQIAQVLAGYTLGEADILRRAMGKKKPEEMAKQREVFREGARKQGVDPDLAMKIFDLVEKFAGYGFNKSHSAAYALVAYQTLYLKTHYPAPFMASALTSEIEKTEKIVPLYEECLRMGLEVKLPDVNRSDYGFSVTADNAIVYGLGAIKGLGYEPAQAIMRARESGGAFVDLYDFCQRVDGKQVNKRALEALVLSGAFDYMPNSPERAILFASITDAVRSAEQQANNQAAGMQDLFADLPVDDTQADVYAHHRHVLPWRMGVRLEHEKKVLGLYMSGHPYAEYAQELRPWLSTELAQLTSSKKTQKIAGLVVDKRSMKSKQGNSFGFMTLDDGKTRVEVGIFNEREGKNKAANPLYDELFHQIKLDQVWVCDVQVSKDEFRGGQRVVARALYSLDDARKNKIKQVRLLLTQQALSGDFCEHLAQHIVHKDENGCDIIVRVMTATCECDVQLGKLWRICPSDEQLGLFKQVYGEQQLELIYR